MIKIINQGLQAISIWSRPLASSLDQLELEVSDSASDLSSSDLDGGDSSCTAKPETHSLRVVEEAHR